MFHFGIPETRARNSSSGPRYSSCLRLHLNLDLVGGYFFLHTVKFGIDLVTLFFWSRTNTAADFTDMAAAGAAAIAVS